MNRFQPDGWHTVTPRIITSKPDELVRFVKEVFDGQGEFRTNRPTAIRVSDSMIVISNGDGLREPVSSFLYVHVEDVDDTYRRTVGAGAESLEIPSDLLYGDRRAMVKDLWGQHVADCFTQAWHVGRVPPRVLDFEAVIWRPKPGHIRVLPVLDWPFEDHASSLGLIRRPNRTGDRSP